MCIELFNIFSVYFSIVFYIKSCSVFRLDSNYKRAQDDLRILIFNYENLVSFLVHSLKEFFLKKLASLIIDV